MLTDASIRAALRAGGIKVLTDGGKRGSGRLALSIRPGVTPEWYTVRYLDGRKQMAKLGTFPDVSLSSARELHKAHTWDRPAKQATLSDLIADYVAHLQANDARTWPDIERTLHRLADVIGKNRAANQVTTQDIADAIRPVYARGCPAMADHMRGAISAAYGWAIRAQNDYRTANQVRAKFGITANPAAGIPTEPKKPGERFLSRDELLQLWRWLGRGSRHDHSPDPRNMVALRVLILTGQRVEEIAWLKRSQVHDGLLDWDETKTGNSHAIPATARVLRLLTWCRRTGDGYFFSDADPLDTGRLRTVVKRFCADTGVPDFTTRDIRRTWKTLAGKAGVSKGDRDLVQNHSSSDVSSRHYDRYDYLPEKGAALNRWENWLLCQCT